MTFYLRYSFSISRKKFTINNTRYSGFCQVILCQIANTERFAQFSDTSNLFLNFTIMFFNNRRPTKQTILNQGNCTEDSSQQQAQCSFV